MMEATASGLRRVRLPLNDYFGRHMDVVLVPHDGSLQDAVRAFFSC